ncbi:MAG: hypothetical protein ACJ79S_09700 [Gemmatimonadaceae bacterium]
MTVDRLTIGIAAGVALAILSGCDAATTTDVAPPTSPLAATALVPPLPDPSDFVPVITNPFVELIPGTTFVYRGETEEGVETNTVEVTSDTKTILGISATVVHDIVYLDGVLAEDTFDWYAQDVSGNVWYLGEDTCEIENGECVSKEGSWEAGVNGAEAGILMWASPASVKGNAYRQELLQGVAEDSAKVLRLDASVEVPYGSFSGCLETMEWSPLEPGVREHKSYCPGTGLVLENQKRGGQIRMELVSISRP